MKASARRSVRLRTALPVLLALGLAAAGAGSQAAPAAADPVVAQVVEMLRAGVGEPVIVLWLEKTGSRPRAVASADLIALHQAGASDDLLKRLVELAAAAAPHSPAAGTGAPPGSAAAPAAPAGQARSAEPAASAAPVPAAPPALAAAPPLAPGAPVKVRFAVTYRPVSVEQEDLWAEHWTLFLYLDGRFLAAVLPGPVPLPLPPHTFERELLPGKHLLRVAQERHLRYSSVRGYLSPSRVDPSELPFELGAGAPAQVELRFGERSFRHPGPVAMRVEQDHKEISRLEPAGTNPERWPALCEDVAASLPAGSELPGTARRDLERCLHWPDLWPGIAAVPSRAAVRAESDRGAGPAGAAPQ